MKKHINLLAVVMFLIVLAALYARAKGIEVPARLGFSSGG
jgi:hypothetical protein